MKKILFSIFVAVMAIGFVGCEYDDSELVGRVDNLEQRVLTLEQLCQQMNTNITAMQAIVNALQTQDAITSVTPITEGSKTIGYTITFAKGEPITIYHGQDGKNGADGEDGKDGYTPVIGVDKDEDGVYYWTLDGEWLTDADGNKIPTSGKDGADGEDGEGGKAGMPELRIQGGYWYVSYDGGENWERLGRATGYDGTDGKDGVDGDAFFDDVVVNEQEGYVTFYFTDGTDPIEIPLYKAFKVEIISTSATYVKVGDTTDVSIKYSITGCTNPTVLEISDLDASASNGVITVKAPTSKDGLDDVETVTLMASNGSTTVMASVELSVYDSTTTITTVNDSTGLSTAITNAQGSSGSENVIYLGSGSYADNIDLTVAALGSNNGDIVFKAAEGTTPVITGTITLGYRDQGTGAAMYNGDVVFDGITFDHADDTKHSIDVQDVKSLTLTNCKIIGGGETGIVSARGNATGPSKIYNCEFVNAGMQILGNFGTGLVIEECVFDNSRINVQAGNLVTVKNCTFNNTLTDANVDDSFYLVRSNSNGINIQNTTMNINSTVTGVATSQAKWAILWARNDTNTKWAVSNLTVNLTSAALAQTELLFSLNQTTTYSDRITITNLKSDSNNVNDIISRSKGYLSANGKTYLDGVQQP